MKQLFNDLSYLIGEEVYILNKDYFYHYPDRIVVVDEYPKHILLEMSFSGSYFGIKVAPRKTYQRINKAAMFCGDIQIRRASDGTLLTGGVIKKQQQIEIKPSAGKPGGFGNSVYLREGYAGH